MSHNSQTCESDLLQFLLASPRPDDDPVRSTASSAAALAVEDLDEVGEEAVGPLLHSPLTEDAALVMAMFEREAELCGADGTAADEYQSATGAGTSGQVLEEEERPPIKEGEELECHSEGVDIKCTGARRDEEKYSTARRTRSAEVHNRCERRRRGRINQRFKTLQELVPRCNDKSDKASILDETIVYMKSLQQQVQMMSGGRGMAEMMLPAIQTCMLPGAAIGMNNIVQPVAATACSGEVAAGGGGCPLHPNLPHGLTRLGPAVSADSLGHQTAASWPLFPLAFQSMAMANFGQAMGAAAIGQQYYKAPNTTSMPYQDALQVGSSPVNGYQFLGIR